MRFRHAGRPLNEEERRLYQPHFPPAVLEAARIVDGQVPFWLRRSMNAVVLGRHIHFRIGAYKAGTLQGITLLAHELTHVEQFLNGMTLLRYLWQSRRGYHRNCYEVEARAKGALVARAWTAEASFAAQA